MKKISAILLSVLVFFTSISDFVVEASEFEESIGKQEENFIGEIELADLNGNIINAEYYEGMEYIIRIKGEENIERKYTVKYYLEQSSEGYIDTPTEMAHELKDYVSENIVQYKFENSGTYILFAEIIDTGAKSFYIKREITVKEESSLTVVTENQDDLAEETANEDLELSNYGTNTEPKDNIGLYTTSNLQIKKFTVNPSDGVNVGEKVSIKAEVEKGSGVYQYQFYVIRDEQEIIIRDYGSSGEFTWGPITPATYKVGVRVKDSSGTVVKKEVEGYKVENSLAIKKFTVNPSDGVNVGEKVSIKAEAEKGSGVYQYQFYVIRDEQEIIIRDYGSSGEFTWGPITPATYKVGVRVKDSSGTVVKKEVEGYKVENSLAIKKFTVNPSDGVNVGEKVSIKAEAEKGSGVYQYQFYVIRDEQEIIIRDYGSNGEFTWGPITPATYKVGVRVKDSSGTVVKKEVEGYKVENSLAIKKFTVNPSDGVNVGEKVSIKAEAEKGSGVYQYQFYVIRDEQEIIIRDYGSNGEFTWGPITPATYKVGVRVKDSSGTVVKKEVEGYKVENSLAIKKFTVNPSDGVNVGEKVSIKAEAEKGSGVYQYQFYVIRDEQEIIIRDYGSSGEFTWGPITPATYKVGVRVKDSSGTVVKKEIEGYKIENSLAIKKFTVNPSDGVNVGEKVSIKAEAEKGSGVYQYQFYVIRDEQEIIIRDYGSNGEFTWGPITPATYKVGVRVKDSSGTVIKKEIGQYTVSERTLKIKNFTSSIADVVKVGDSTVLSADVVNGVEPYEYKFYVVRDEQEILLRDFSKSNEYIWGPITPAEYEVHVMVRDAVGNIADEYIPITVERYKIEISEFKVGNNVEAYAGESVYISTKAKGGKGELTYRYYAIRNGQEIQLREDITGNIFIWGPVTPAQYEVCVEVQDSIGNKETATIPFEVKYTDFKITKFMMSKTGISYKGEPIVLSAAAEGGSGNYQYRFYVIRDGSEIVLQNYSTKTSYTWGPITPADYYVCVDVKDINTGTILTKILQITIELSVLNGIDVSEWQGTIDWKQVKNSGVDFAMLRILSGTMDNLTVDPTFYNNIRNATENGISVGVYRYGYAKNVSEARREANMVVNTLKSSGYSISYPVAYDVEDEAVQGKLSKAELTAIIKTFKSIIEENGYKFMIYANKNWLENKIDMSQFSQDDVWIAQYRDYTPNLGYQYNGPGNVTIWQYSSKGRVPGISGDVDMNVGYKRY